MIRSIEPLVQVCVPVLKSFFGIGITNRTWQWKVSKSLATSVLIKFGTDAFMNDTCAATPGQLVVRVR